MDRKIPGQPHGSFFFFSYGVVEEVVGNSTRVKRIDGQSDLSPESTMLLVVGWMAWGKLWGQLAFRGTNL